MVKSSRVLRRHLLQQLLPVKAVRRKFAIDMNAELPILWLENEAGDVVVPDLTGDMPPNTPKGFIYQHSRFPRTLVHNCLKMVTEEEVNTCAHEEVLADHGLIEGLEGRICRMCGGSQTKDAGAPWPAEWKSGGSRDMFSGSSTYPTALVLAMVRPSPEEIAKAGERGHQIEPMDFERAILFAGTSCERCMNVLLWRYGCDDGYEEGSPDWERSNTSCKLCEKEFPPKPFMGIPAVYEPPV